MFKNMRSHVDSWPALPHYKMMDIGTKASSGLPYVVPHFSVLE